MKTSADVISKLEQDIAECHVKGIAEYQRSPDCWLLFKNSVGLEAEHPTGIPIAGFKSVQGLRKGFLNYYKGDSDICLVAYWLED